ncbi:MAG: hypothetical protein M1819_002943 [Sarea resinae]|nr:MAG: hypothetical protein M1819_002943 [Sarea resinae]
MSAVQTDSGSHPERRKRRVVSSFICTPPDDPKGFKVVIFKRSDKVHTYKGKWAACSGSIELDDKDPLAAAKREIEEETNLNANDLTLLRAGKPFSIVDDSYDTEWTIYPFAFELKPGAKDVVIDWEHTESRFVPPAEVKDFETVPHLTMSLYRSVVGKDTAAGLKDLQQDHSSGARVLATKAVQTLLKVVQGDDLAYATDVDSFWTGLRLAGWHLATNGRLSMGAAINYAVLSALDAIKGAQPLDSGVKLADFKETAERCLTDAIHERDQSGLHLADQFRSYLSRNRKDGPIHILTVSSSSTVRQCLTRALKEDPNLKVVLKVMESRPLFEGVSFISSFLEELGEEYSIAERIHVEVASDVSAGILARDADIVIIGADRISEAGDVSNKTGSLAAALLAKESNKDVRVLALTEVEKVAGPGKTSEHVEEENDRSELTEAWPLDEKEKKKFLGDGRVTVKNVYFEWVPAKYIDCYICEKGVLSTAEIGKQSRHVKELEDDLFGEL